jgi:signal transduction histidine kinase
MLRRFYGRVRELDEFKADAILAGAFAIAGVIESLLINTHGHSRPLTAIVAAVFPAPLAWRRRNTLFALAGFMLILLAQAPLDTFVIQSLTTPWVGVMLVAYTAGRYEPSRRMWIELALVALVINVPSLFDGSFSVGNLFWTSIITGAPILAGRAIRSRVLLQREMRDKAHRLETERHVRAQRAVDDERARIASELQAVVANGVSAMVVQAGAVPRLIENGDSGRAGQALAVIEETGRDALTEMRRLLGVLRRDGDGPALAPQPTLASADALVARIREEGLDAYLTVQGQPTPLSPGVDLAGYRVLQEALASARGADGVSHADVAIVYGDGDVTLTVRDDRESRDGPDAAALRALRERVGLYGGALRVVPRADDGGFEMEARLPIGGPS